MTDFVETASLTDARQPTIQIISNTERIKQYYINLIKTSRDEILLIFPTINAIHREYSIGVLDELKNAVQRGVKVRILSAEDDFIKEKLDALRSNGIVIRRIEAPSESKFKMLIIDKKVAFVVETKDDTKAEFRDAVGNAMFSNSKTTVLPYVTIFESFWRETDLYEKARESDRIKDEFVNTAAHELRNPIMPIISGAELLGDLLAKAEGQIDGDLYNEMVGSSRLVTRNAIKLLRLSEDILQLNRLENGTFSLNLDLTDIDEIIKSAIIDIKKRYEGERPNVNIIYDSTTPAKQGLKIYCDSSKISQTMINLLDNAMKFTVDGEVMITVTPSQNEIYISVRDSGTGIDPAIKNRLFEKFATKSNSGTGLGLYLSRKIVEAHGGRIWNEDNQGRRGTTFYFSIPNDLIP